MEDLHLVKQAKQTKLSKMNRLSQQLRDSVFQDSNLSSLY